MGYDASCTLTYEGKSTKGTAWLETKELIFRGPPSPSSGGPRPERVKIPLAEISSATARNGTLRVKFGTRQVDFAIGDAAEKWAKRITNPPSRLDKLGIKPGMAVATIGLADAPFSKELEERAAKQATATMPRTKGTLDAIFYGASHRDALALDRLTPLIAAIKDAGAIWIVRPKGRPEITEAETMAAGKRAGLVDVKVVAFSDTHTAEKYVIPVGQRGRAKPVTPKQAKPAKADAKADGTKSASKRK